MAERIEVPLAAQVDVHTNLGDLWRAQGPSGQAEAQRCYAEALRVDVCHAPAWRGLGDLMRERGEHTPAVACYQARHPPTLCMFAAHHWMCRPLQAGAPLHQCICCGLQLAVVPALLCMLAC